jgi:hypothetical protein
MLKNLYKRNILNFSTKFEKVFNYISNISSKKISNTKLKIQEIKPFEKTEYKLKDFFFKYRGNEYRSEIPIVVDQSFEEFLNFFAKKELTDQSKSFLDYEVSRAGHYLPKNLLVNSLKTKSEDKYPITVYEEQLTLENGVYRNLTHLKNPYETHSNTFQNFLSNFIDSEEIEANQANIDNLRNLLRTLSNVKSTKSKQIIATGALLDIMRTSSNGKFLMDIKNNETIKLDHLNKSNKSNVILIFNRLTNSLIPINFVVGKDQTELTENFNKEIMDNFDNLRRVYWINKKKTNFGIVTNFNIWKFNYYHKQAENLVEDIQSYHTSLKYKLEANSEFVDKNSLNIILKVLSGLIQFKSDQQLSE